MDATLRALCRDLDLTTVSVGLYSRAKSFPISVFLHWADAECASGSGDTFDDALRMARAEMDIRRGTRRVAPAVGAEFLGLDAEDRSGECA